MAGDSETGLRSGADERPGHRRSVATGDTIGGCHWVGFIWDCVKGLRACVDSATVNMVVGAVNCMGAEVGVHSRMLNRPIVALSEFVTMRIATKNRHRAAAILLQAGKSVAYRSLLKDIKSRIRIARIKASLAVNRELIQLYWDIGESIVKRQRAEGWGKSVVERIAADVQKAFPGIEGFSPQNIWKMRGFFLAWTQDVQDLSRAVRERRKSPFLTGCERNRWSSSATDRGRNTVGAQYGIDLQAERSNTASLVCPSSDCQWLVQSHAGALDRVRPACPSRPRCDQF